MVKIQNDKIYIRYKRLMPYISNQCYQLLVYFWEMLYAPFCDYTVLKNKTVLADGMIIFVENKKKI